MIGASNRLNGTDTFSLAISALGPTPADQFFYLVDWRGMADSCLCLHRFCFDSDSIRKQLLLRLRHDQSIDATIFRQLVSRLPAVSGEVDPDQNRRYIRQRNKVGKWASNQSKMDMFPCPSDTYKWKLTLNTDIK